MPRKRSQINPTVMKMTLGLMRFKRRLDIPMWHVDHINKVANMFREYADRIEAVQTSNSMRGSDKTMYCQRLIQQMNHDLGSMTPLDPRERGAEMLRYTETGLVDERGFDELSARNDMED